VDNLWPIVTPIVVSVLLSLAGALAISKYAGPAQAAYVQALEGRLAIVTKARDDAEADLPHLRARILELERQVEELKSDRAAKDREVAELYRRLDARVLRDERRLAKDERELGINTEGKP
jgi:hypothetical protein